jgi:hypothetical protein
MFFSLMESQSDLVVAWTFKVLGLLAAGEVGKKYAYQ